MELITSAIIAALVSGINAVGSEAVKDAYSALKGWLLKHLPNDSSAADDIEELERNPEAESPQNRLNTELIQAKVAENAELKALLTALYEKMNESEKGKAALSKYKVTAEKIGIVGDYAKVETQNF